MLDFPKKLAVLVYLAAVPIVFIYVFSESIPGRLEGRRMLLAVHGGVVIFNARTACEIRSPRQTASHPLLWGAGRGRRVGGRPPSHTRIA